MILLLGKGSVSGPISTWILLLPWLSLFPSKEPQGNGSKIEAKGFPVLFAFPKRLFSLTKKRR